MIDSYFNMLNITPYYIRYKMSTRIDGNQIATKIVESLKS